MKHKVLFTLLTVGALFTLAACGEPFRNPGDKLGGGGTAELPSEAGPGSVQDANDAAGDPDAGTAIPEDAVPLADGKISAAGSYLVQGEFGKISVEAENVVLYLDGAVLSNEKKVIESKYGLTITLSGENSVRNTNEGGSNAIDCEGDLLINGTGSLAVGSTKNAIKANSISVKDATLVLESEKDGLHAEIGAYDDLTEAPVFSYDDGGYVTLADADLTVRSGGDGIQADTFVLIKGETSLDITANGGAPQTITEASSDSGDGKGIKAGPIDYGPEDANGECAELTAGDYLVAITGGTVLVNANDDGIHSDSEIALTGGTVTVSAGDDGVHADNLLRAEGGTVTVTKSYEGMEAAKVEISGGTYLVNAVDDGVNVADGTTYPMGQANPNCHLIVSGGELAVNAEGDGLDSNGTMLISGGKVYVAGPTRDGNAALDSDGGILVNGGYLWAVGPLGMVETPAKNSAQNILSYATNGTVAAETVLSLTDENGEPIFSFETPKTCSSVILSCPELTTGGSFALYGGGAKLCSFTVSSTITTVGSSGGARPNGPHSGPSGPSGPFGPWS